MQITDTHTHTHTSVDSVYIYAVDATFLEAVFSAGGFMTHSRRFFMVKKAGRS